jgi:hypothetical protein
LKILNLFDTYLSIADDTAIPMGINGMTIALKICESHIDDQPKGITQAMEEGRAGECNLCSLIMPIRAV